MVCWGPEGFLRKAIARTLDAPRKAAGYAVQFNHDTLEQWAKNTLMIGIAGGRSRLTTTQLRSCGYPAIHGRGAKSGVTISPTVYAVRSMWREVCAA